MSPGALTLCRPLLSFDYVREAYVLRGIGARVGPVLREERRRSSDPGGAYMGPERRGFGRAPVSGPSRGSLGTSRNVTAAGADAAVQIPERDGQPAGEASSGPRQGGSAKASTRGRRRGKSARNSKRARS